MNGQQSVSRAIILSRVNYGEADRILTVLTPAYGKVSLLAKGVRKPKSKLAGGIELLSISDITFTKPASGGLGRLISARLHQHYAAIGADIDRLMLAYELMKLLHKVTEDHTEEAHYDVAAVMLAGLHDPQVEPALIEGYVIAKLLAIEGRAPNFTTDTDGRPLHEQGRYTFSFDEHCCVPAPSGNLAVRQLKYIRLLLSPVPLGKLRSIGGVGVLAVELLPFLRQLQRAYLLQ